MSYQAWVATGKGATFTKQSLERGPLGPEEVEVAVDHCGICHSDLSMLNNEWGMSTFPAVFGHEVVGRVTAMGSMAKGLKTVIPPHSSGPALARSVCSGSGMAHAQCERTDVAKPPRCPAIVGCA